MLTDRESAVTSGEALKSEWPSARTVPHSLAKPTGKFSGKAARRQ